MRFRLREGEAPLISRLPARMVAATCLMLVAMVLALAWTREAGNSSARNSEEARLTATLDAKLRQMVLTTIDMSANPNVAGSKIHEFDIAEELNAPAGADILTTAIGARLAGPLTSAQKAITFGLRGSLANDARTNADRLRIYPRDSASGFTHIGPDIFAWTIVPAHRESADGARSPRALLRYEAVDDALLAKLASSADAAFVKLLPVAPEGASEPSFTFLREGEPIHVTWKADRPGDRLTHQLSTLLITIMALYTGFVAYHMTRKLAESELEKARLAAQDLLTGLPNRLLFTLNVEDEIARAQRSNSDFALFYLDFDRFKEINDTFGHDAGDMLIVAAGQRIESVLRKGDRIARFSGDEFGIIQLEVKSLRDCELLAERVIACVREPFDIKGRRMNINVSIGIAVSRHGHEDRAELMRRADLALYRAKNPGRGRFVFYDDAMNSELQRQKRVEDDFRLALERDELEVYYQPIVHARSQKLAGVEALVRWNHPQNGVVSPHEFISIAEERGMIADLGRWVLRRACQDAIHWPGIKLAVNVSAMQFRHQDFLPDVKQIISETGYDPSRLELELTESVMIDDADQAEQAIIELRAMGVRLALDDFGTGYSSLIYLRRFAIDKIKIDRSFVEVMEMSSESMEIVRNVAELGHRLGLIVTAEGVETEEQVPLLESFGCHELQGYLFGKPVSRLHVAAMITAEKVRAAPNHAASGKEVAVKAA